MVRGDPGRHCRTGVLARQRCRVPSCAPRARSQCSEPPTVGGLSGVPSRRGNWLAWPKARRLGASSTRTWCGRPATATKSGRRTTTNWPSRCCCRMGGGEALAHLVHRRVLAGRVRWAISEIPSQESVFAALRVAILTEPPMGRSAGSRRRFVGIAARSSSPGR